MSEKRVWVTVTIKCPKCQRVEIDISFPELRGELWDVCPHCGQVFRAWADGEKVMVS